MLENRGGGHQQGRILDAGTLLGSEDGNNSNEDGSEEKAWDFLSDVEEEEEEAKNRCKNWEETGRGVVPRNGFVGFVLGLFIDG